MIITLTGENTFAIAEAARHITDAFAAKHGAAGIERVDAEELDAARLPDLLQGATLFAAVRLVVFKNVSANKGLLDPLTKALEHVSGDTTVVVADSSLDKRTKLYKFLKTHGTFKECKPLPEAALLSWLQKYAQTIGAVLDEKAARYMLGRVGHDQWRLKGELEKLAHYPSTITHQVIDELTEATPEASAFGLLDMALEGRAEESARLITALKTQEDPYKLFGLLASQVHALALAAAADGRAPDQVAKDSGLHPYVVRKTMQTAKRLPSGRIAAMAEAVATCDAQLKSTSAEPWQLIQAALGKIAQR